VSLERFLGVKYPLDHSRLLSRPRILLLLTTVWILSFSLTALAVFAFPDEENKLNINKSSCGGNLRVGHVLIVVIGMLYIPLAIIGALYWSIWSIASSHLQQKIKNRNSSLLLEVGGPGGPSNNIKPRDSFHSEDEGFSLTEITMNTDLDGPTSTTASTATTNVQRRMLEVSSRRQIQLAKRLAILVGVVAFCYFPYYTALLLRALDKGLVPIQIYNGLKWLRYLNSAFNPVLYALAIPAYSHAIRNTLIRFRGKLLPFS
jgi:hypothetical protein